MDGWTGGRSNCSVGRAQANPVVAGHILVFARWPPSLAYSESINQGTNQYSKSKSKPIHISRSMGI